MYLPLSIPTLLLAMSQMAFTMPNPYPQYEQYPQYQQYQQQQYPQYPPKYPPTQYSPGVPSNVPPSYTPPHNVPPAYTPPQNVPPAYTPPQNVPPAYIPPTHQNPQYVQNPPNWGGNQYYPVNQGYGYNGYYDGYVGGHGGRRIRPRIGKTIGGIVDGLTGLPFHHAYSIGKTVDNVIGDVVHGVAETILG